MAIVAILPKRLVPALAAALLTTSAGAAVAPEPPHSAELDAAIVRAAKRHGVPERLVRRIVMRESRYDARARNHAYWGLMQISYPTARSMGFRGTPDELLNPFTNLTYAVPYLANAFIVAGKKEDAAVRLYASGYYATAKSRGVLGLLRTAASNPLNGIVDDPAPLPTAVASDSGIWSGLFGSSAPATPTPPASEPAPAPSPQLAYAASPEAAAAASPAQAQIQAIAPVAPEGAGKPVKTSDKNAGDGVDMVAARDGSMTPPKRWQHDGGTTRVSRGEQGAERLAATRLGQAATETRHSRKTNVFAQLDAPGADAGQASADASAPAAGR